MHRRPPALLHELEQRAPYTRVLEPERNEGTGHYRYYWRKQLGKKDNVAPRYLDDPRLQKPPRSSGSELTTNMNDRLPPIINFAEFCKIVKYKHCTSWDQRQYSTAQLRQHFDSIDDCRDGLITKAEYYAWCLPRAFVNADGARVREVFAQFERDGQADAAACTDAHTSPTAATAATIDTAAPQIAARDAQGELAAPGSPTTRPTSWAWDTPSSRPSRTSTPKTKAFTIPS